MEDILQELIHFGRITELREQVGNLLKEGNWSNTKKRLKNAIIEVPWYSKYIGILRLFEIELLEGIDLSAEDVLDALPSYRKKMSFDQIRKVMRQSAGELIQDQLKQNGSTLFFDVDTIANTEFVFLVPEILELRQKQFMSAYKKWLANEDSDLQNMMQTHYGNEILRSLEGNITNSKLSSSFQKVIDEIGIVEPYPWTEINMSEEFKKLAMAKVNFAAAV